MNTASCLNLIEEALRFEEEGRAFFLKAAGKTRNPFGKLMFEAIADSELKHMEQLREIQEELNRHGQWPDQCAAFESLGPVRNVFERALAELTDRVRGDTDDVKATELARAYEEKGIRFYQDLAAKAQGDVERLFYERLAEEERGHLIILEDMHQYFVDPVHWFSEKERLHWDGA